MDFLVKRYALWRHTMRMLVTFPEVQNFREGDQSTVYHRATARSRALLRLNA